MIRSLDQNVRSLLRSGIAVSSLTQCLDELVVNSLDAEATCVSVRVDIPSLRLQVIDNGFGISREDLELLGERYATSKCHSLEDLRELKYYGFRGEALASVCDIAGILEVVTRHKSSYKTYCKIFQNGKAVKVSESCLPRSTVGTTITAYEVFSSFPVRQKLISDVFDFERIRQRLASIALINPNVSFTLYNEASGQKCLQTHKSLSVVSTFSQLFGNLKAKSLREIFLKNDSLKISGYVGLETHHNKNFQFVYVNGRLLLKTKIHKLVNRVLTRSRLLKRTLVFDDAQGDAKQVSLPKVSKQSTEKYPIFIINICCSLMEYDITLEPTKTLVEFEDWDGVLSCVQTSVESFIAKEGLMLPTEQSEDIADINNGSQTDDYPIDSQVDLSVFEYQTTSTDSNKCTHCISPSNVKKSLHSLVVRRKGDRNGLVSNAPEVASHNIELSNNTEKSSLNEVTKNWEKNHKQPKQYSLESGIEKSFAKMSNNETSLCSRAHILLQGSNTTYGRTYSESCFTSPNPITLQSRRTRKRLHNDAGIKKMDNDNCSSSQSDFILDRYEKASRINGTHNHSNEICIISELSSRIPITRDILTIHKSSLLGSPDGKSAIGQGKENESMQSSEEKSCLNSSEENRQHRRVVERSLEEITLLDDNHTDDVFGASKTDNTGKENESMQSSEEKSCLNSSEENRQHRRVVERSLDEITLLDDNHTDDVFGASKTDNTETQLSSLFNQDLVLQENHNNKAYASANKSVGDKDERNLSSRSTDTFNSGILDNGSELYDEIPVESSSSELRATFRDLSPEEDHIFEAPKKMNGIYEKIRKDSDNDRCDGRGFSQCFAHKDKKGPPDNWQCTYDTNLQRKLYINLRTGNTCYECPEGFAGETLRKEEAENQINERETRVRCPLACAPHVSFNYTPWLPREKRENKRVTRSTQPGSEMKDCITSSPQSLVDERATKKEPMEGSASLVSLMFDEWNNPVFESLPEMDITSLSKPTKGTGNEVRAHRSVYPYRFTKDMVKKLQVIRQIDDRFIACRVRRPREDEDDGNAYMEIVDEEDYLIVLLDQHAVHERIRLEKLLSDLYVSETSHVNQPHINSATVSPPIELEFTSHELLLLKRFRNELQRVGVRFVIGSDLKTSESRLIVHELPSPFVDREVSETRRRRPSVAVSIIKELIQSHVEHLRQTSGVAPAIPRTILRVLSSQACHGAVKFGERLSVEECQQLIQDLSTCYLPFQCAHGRLMPPPNTFTSRPSIVPLVDLQLLKRKALQLEATHERPKLSKLTNAINA